MSDLVKRAFLDDTEATLKQNSVGVRLNRPRWQPCHAVHLQLLFLGLVFALLSPARSGMAQASSVRPDDGATIDLAAGRDPVTTVSTRWRFHAGDNMAWAQADFDDSAWKMLDPARPWGDQGYTADGEVVWFRVRVRVAPETPALVLEMPRVMKNYQIFADGREVAAIGNRTSDKGGLTTAASRVFTLPRLAAQPAGDGSRDMQLALRMRTPKQYAWNSPDVLPGPARVGAPKELLAQFARSKAYRLLQREGTNYTTTLLQVPIMAAALLLLVLTRERFYLWFALQMAIAVLAFTTHMLAPHAGWEFRTVLAANILWDFANGLTLALFLAGFLRLRSLRLVYLAILTQALAEIGPALVPFHLPALWANVIYFVFITVSDLLLLWLIVKVWKAGAIEAGLFLIPYMLSTGVVDVGNFGYVLVELQVPGVTRWIPAEIALLTSPFTVTLLDVANIISLFGFLAVLVYRFARTSREQQRLSAALQAAHEIQDRLLPADLATHRGLHTEVVYLAAEEVGGDFCQVLPRSNGSVLAVIGDVSGKGLQAAMVGALAVGALRSLIEEQAAGPALVLQRMNEVILRSAEQGFVTCLCVEIHPDGTMTVANAGHLSPYVNGVEIHTEPDLPLGIVPGLTYAQTQITLPAKARLTLLSDGVVEARSRSGELFGFTRTLDMSDRAAGEIAAAAQEFGQEDDITVVTLNWNAAAA